MKPTVNFFSLEKSQDLYISTCFLVKELYKLGDQVIIFDDNSNLDKLDKLLWTFEQNSFLPHKVYQTGDNRDTPIILLSEKYVDNLLIFNEYDSIINNFNQPITKNVEDFKMYEFVEDFEEKKIISRKKYTIYKNNDYNLKHKKYNEQTI